MSAKKLRRRCNEKLSYIPHIMGPIPHATTRRNNYLTTKLTHISRCPCLVMMIMTLPIYNQRPLLKLTTSLPIAQMSSHSPTGTLP